MDQVDIARAIRRQVEFYFSDENLARPDRFLIRQMRGIKNRPVPLSTIHGFAKMREFQPEQLVIDALKESEELDLVKIDDTKWGVKRKTAFVQGEVTDGGQKVLKPPKPPKPTGFETFYADAPVDPATFDEESTLYDEDRPFSERIEIALQRYQTKRRFHSLPRKIFDKFLKFGGINTGPKQFVGGISQDDLADKTAAEIAALTATHYVGDDKEPDDDEEITWVVDFEAVAKGFFSSQFQQFFELIPAEIDMATTTIHNFYNYLLHHNVSPAHTTSINAARQVCIIANTQLHAIRSISSALPGHFNKACSTYFGGSYQNLQVGPSEAGTERAKVDADEDDAVGLSRSVAKSTVAVGVAAMQPESSHGPEFWSQTIVSSIETGLEVTDIELPNELVRSVYARFPKLDALGILRAKSWIVPSFAEDDLPAEVAQQRSREGAARTFEFWVEEKILRECFLGMKLQATVQVLSGGVMFLDIVTAVHCAFYEELPNELLRGWREPRWQSREETVARLNGTWPVLKDGGNMIGPEVQVSKVEVGNGAVKEAEEAEAAD